MISEIQPNTLLGMSRSQTLVQASIMSLKEASCSYVNLRVGQERQDGIVGPVYSRSDELLDTG
jgi:hypothetical protein